MSTGRTVEALRQALDGLPGTAAVIVEDELGWKFALTRAFPIGRSTDDPGLVLKVIRYYPADKP